MSMLLKGKFRINKREAKCKVFLTYIYTADRHAVIDIKYFDVSRNFIKNFDVRVPRQYKILCLTRQVYRCSSFLVPAHFVSFVDDYGIHNLLFLFYHISGKMFREAR